MVAHINEVLGTSISSLDELRAFKSHAPAELGRLEAICKYFEAEMIRCKESNAFFAAAVLSGSMIESMLMLLCHVESKDVQRSRAFKKYGKPKNDYQKAVTKLKFEALIAIAEELSWVSPNSVREEFRERLRDHYLEVLQISSPELGVDELSSRATWGYQNPGGMLFLHIQEMRNLLHGGRWVAHRKDLNEPVLAEWAKIIVVMAAEVRDCLALYFNQRMQQRIAEMARLVRASDGT